MEGLRIRSFEAIYKANLAKICWMLAEKVKRVWVDQVLTKYCHRKDFLNCNNGRNYSKFW